MSERKLTKSDKEIAEAAIRDRMKREFTFMDLYFAGDKAIGWKGTYGFAGSLIQKRRRAGEIEIVRHHVWREVPRADDESA